MEEVIKLKDAYVQESHEVQGKYEILGQMWSSWAGNYWEVLGMYETEEEATEEKNKIVKQ